MEMLRNMPNIETLKAGLSVGQAARPLDTPDKPSRPIGKDQTGVD
jgi:hypothetical protein